jgi:hypothetical protein
MRIFTIFHNLVQAAAGGGGGGGGGGGRDSNSEIAINLVKNPKYLQQETLDTVHSLFDDFMFPLWLQIFFCPKICTC